MSASQAIKLTPGQQLSAARKRSGMSLAEIANATRIFESRLEAIERDDYAAAGTAAPFVIGYVKAYAKAVDVAPQPLVQVLESYFSQQKATLEKNKPVVEKKTTFSLLPWLAAGIAVAIFIGLGKWFFAGDLNEQSQLLSNSGASIASQMSASMKAEEIIKSRDETTPLTQRDNNLMPRELVEEQQSEQDIKSVDLVDTQIVGGYSEEEINESVVNPQVQPATTIASENQSVRTNADSQAPESLPVEVGSDVLTLQFNGECWLEVYSADGNRLASKLVNDGDSLRLVGRAPFDVKLGDATTAVGEVNGRTLDLTPKLGRRVLRIQVGP